MSICQVCNENPATFKFLQVQDDQSSEVHLCQSCAEERGLKPKIDKQNFAISDVIAGMVDDMSPGQEGRVGPVQCPNCGMHYSTFKETGRLGCANCYASFESKLRPLLRRIHGSTRHTGKHPVRGGEAVALRRKVQRLQDELQRAIDREDFEAAAELRDRIRELEHARASQGNPAEGEG